MKKLLLSTIALALPIASFAAAPVCPPSTTLKKLSNQLLSTGSPAPGYTQFNVTVTPLRAGLVVRVKNSTSTPLTKARAEALVENMGPYYNAVSERLATTNTYVTYGCVYHLGSHPVPLPTETIVYFMRVPIFS